MANHVGRSRVTKWHFLTGALLLFVFLVGHGFRDAQRESSDYIHYVKSSETPNFAAHQEIVHHVNRTIIINRTNDPTNEESKTVSTESKTSQPTSSKTTESPTAQPSTSSATNFTKTNERRYLCLSYKWAGNSNALLEIAIAKQVATKHNLELALIFGDGEDYNKSFPAYFEKRFESNPGITVAKEGEIFNCQKKLTGKRAFSTHFRKFQKNPFLPEIGKYLWPHKDIREKAERAISEKFGGTSFLSVHRRAMTGCYTRSRDRSFVGNDFPNNCTNTTAYALCDLDYKTVQEQFNPTNLTVVLFTDGRRPDLDDTFPIRDDEHFYVQFWMMSLSERHVGHPVSSVDMTVTHYRHSMGNSHIYPEECFYDFKEDLLIAERAEEYQRLRDQYNASRNQ